MAKKSGKEKTEWLGPQPVINHDDTVFLVREDPNQRQERLRRAAAPGTGALKAPAPIKSANPPPPPAREAGKP